jgi:hypothetical protein
MIGSFCHRKAVRCRGETAKLAMGVVSAIKPPNPETTRPGTRVSAAL